MNPISPWEIMMTGGLLANVPCLLDLSFSELLENFLLAVCMYPDDGNTDFLSI